MGKIESKEKKKIDKTKKEIAELRKKRRKERKKKDQKRIERKMKLIKLGTLFRVLNLLEKKQEVMLGFLEGYLKLSMLEKEKLTDIGDKILSENELKSYDDDLSNRKRMFYLMIRKAALLEKLNIHLENPRTILGFLNNYRVLTEEEKIKLSKRGMELFTPLEKKILKKEKVNEEASDKERVEVLIYLRDRGIDSTKFLKEKFNTSIHGLKKKQAEKILKGDI